MPAPAATPALPSSVVSLDLEGKSVFLLGTAHVSRKSVDDVRAAAAALAPDTVAVELCEPRYRSLSDPNAWRDTALFKVVRQKKTAFLLAQLAMQAFYRRVGKRLETEPGAEMMEAARIANATGARLELVDRRIDLTLKRVWAALGFWQKTKLAGLLLSSLFSSGDEVSAEDVENLKQSDQLESAMAELGRAFPGVKSRLMDERAQDLAEKIRRAPGTRVLAVVGAGHVPGILRNIRAPRDLAPLEALPPPARWSRVWPWLITLAVS
ncbi:MAG: TraB/GumN family protein, partial [Kiritimatiellae bacterium]|nr:TraB/GumN family protein [Kiritimatiellia bacterium]